jgi:hypothetical protein
MVTEASFGGRSDSQERAGDQQGGQQRTELHGRLLDVKKVGGKGSGFRRRFATVCGVYLRAFYVR